MQSDIESGIESELMVRGAQVTWIGWLTDIAIHRLCHVEVRGRENFTCSPSTLVLSNHLRDTDGPILASTLIDRHGFSAHGVQPHIVAREDLFRKGFLREYLTMLPQWVRELLSPIGLSRVMRSMQVCPMRRIPEMSLEEVLQDVCGIFGDLPLRQVLKPRWAERFEKLTPPGERAELSAAWVQRCRYRSLLRLRHGLAKLNLAFFQTIEPYERMVIDTQLQYLIQLLENGRIVQMQPEGILSRNGGMAPFRSGLHALINRPRVPIRVLPVGITYDFMTTGRPYMFVNMGPELKNLQARPRKAVNMAVARAIFRQSTVTATCLSGPMLAMPQGRRRAFTANELIRHVGREANRLAAAGMLVDPRLLSHVALTRRIHRFLRYGVRAGMIVRRRNRFYCSRHASLPARVIRCGASEATRYVSNEWSALKGLRPGFMEGFPV